ncbi:MAG: signal peptide peptidase SppA [Phycisphaeraceae bacterium]
MALYYRLFVLTLLSSLAAGCGPTTFVVGLAPGDREMTQTVVEKPETRTRHRVAMIDVTGVLMNASTDGLLSQGDNPVSAFSEALDKAAEDDRVKAVVLRLNTPGGAVAASDMMYREVIDFKAETNKPVVVVMMDVAASGGYYIACASDYLIAYPSTVTASIGVIFQTVSFQPALTSIGIQTEAITSGPNKDAGSPLTTLTDSHRAVYRDMVDTFYTGFTTIVRQARPGISDEHFEEVTDGRVVTGVRAKEVGLVDALGDLDDAFAKAKALANIKDAALVRYHRPLEYVGSPYASANPNTPRANATQVNLLQLNLDGAGGKLPSSCFYYVWLPGVR